MLTINNIKFRLKNMKRNLLAMNPHEKWKLFRRIHLIILKKIGTGFMDESYKVNVKTIIPIFLEVSHYILLIYTLYHYRNKPFNALISTTYLGIFAPVSLFPYLKPLLSDIFK